MELNRRQFGLSFLAASVAIALPRHKHQWIHPVNSDAAVCRCGEHISGLEMRAFGIYSLPEYGPIRRVYA